MEYYLHEVHLGVIRYARQAGWALDWTGYHGFSIPSGWRGHGMITHLVTPAFARWVGRFRGPVVDLGSAYPDMEIPRIHTDGRAIGRMAAEHLLGQGYRRLVLIGSPGSAVMRLRDQGCREVAGEAGATVDRLDFTSRGRMAPEFWRRLAEGVRRLPLPCGILAENDEVAMNLVDVAVEAGRRVPEDTGVLGVGNQHLARDLCQVPLSSVDSRIEAKGYQAAALLDRMLRGEPAPAEPVRIAPAGVVERRSTQARIAGHPGLTAAMRFLDAHFREPIQAQDLAQAAGMSRRRMQDLMRQALGRTPRQELERRRIDEACRRLDAGAGKLHQVAVECGYASLAAFDRAFRRVRGCSPTAWRQRPKGVRP